MIGHFNASCEPRNGFRYFVTFNKSLAILVKEFALEKSTWSINVGAGVKLINHIQAGINYNIPVSKEGAYNLYENQTVDNAVNAASEAGNSIKASTLQFSLTWTF